MIHLYAEHLLNIRTLSIQASLSTVSNQETKATLSADGSILTLTHQGDKASITLPINLSPNRESTVKLTIPAVPSRQLNFRVQLEARDGVKDGVLSNGQQSTDEGNIVPWSAPSLPTDTELRCRDCGNVVLPRGHVREWKDLPSEGWAEMMDFWHCHKPNEPHSHESAPTKQGYGANSQLALLAGVGMVGVMDFLLVAADCSNISVPSDPKDLDTPRFIHCAQCRSTLGQLDPATQGYRLRKSQLSLSPSADLSPATYPAEKWFACMLLSAMDSQGVRKFTIRHPARSDGENALKLWLFAPDLSISSSRKTSNAYIRVCKVLWQDHHASQSDDGRLNGSSLSEGELQLRRDEYDSLRETLKDSAAILPEEARIFQEWQVGLLERFTSYDLP